MKKILLFAALVAVVATSASAQAYRRGRYYNSRNGRLDYSQRNNGVYNHRTRGHWRPDVYYGFRVGPTFSCVSSDDNALDGSSMKTGLNAGMTIGFGLSPYTPIALESGLYYTEKGGKSKISGTSDKFTYNLSYLEMPLVFKYIYSPDGHFTIEPHFGGYLSCGVGGKIKDYYSREAYSSFDSDVVDHFNRFDGGLRFGCGVGYDMIYAEVTYDLGLSNIGSDAFNETKTRSLMINFGVNF